MSLPCGSVKKHQCMQGVGPAYTKLQTVLTDCFKCSSFRPGQLTAVIPVLHGRDVIAKMATGAGKSLCFFLVPLVRSRTAI